MDTITLWLNNAGRYTLDQVQTAELLAKLGRTTDEKVRTILINKICQGNLRLVYTTTKAYADRRQIRWGSELSADLLQAGFFGLHHAVGRYDAKYGTRLSTIAVPWIKQKLGRYLNTKERVIYVPEGLVREIHYMRNHGKASGSKATPKNPELLQFAQSAMKAPTSIDVKIGDDGSCLADLLQAPEVEGGQNPADELATLLDKAQVKPQVKEMVLHYTAGGRLDSAARQCNINVKTARMQYDAAIARIKELV